jgi:hypothetical protein
MKNKFIALAILGVITLSMSPPPPLLSNGGFESYTTIPTCSNLAITQALSWQGLKVEYNSTCNLISSSWANSGSINDPKYYNIGSSGTASCPPATGALPATGNGFAYLFYNGFYPNSTARSNFLLGSLKQAIPANTLVSISVKINSLGTFNILQNQMMAYLVPTSTPNTPADILGYIRTKSIAAQIPTPTNTFGGGWITSSYSITTPSGLPTGYYVVVGPCNLWCNDGSVGTIYKALIDDVSISY